MLVTPPLAMPSITDRQAAADALEQAYITNVIAELEAQVVQDTDDLYDFNPLSDSESGSSDSTSSASTLSTASSDNSSTSSPSLSDGMAAIEDITESYVQQLAELFSKRYYSLRGKITKQRALIRLLLDDYKISRPEIFRKYVRIEPACFDDLVGAIRDDPAFHNNSSQEQMPVEEQLVIALYRFGHYGNASSTLKVFCA